MENQINYEEIYNDYVEQSLQQALMESMNGEAQPGKEHIVAVRKNEDGDLIAFQTESGRVLDYVTALNEAKQGKLAHVDVFHKYGRDILRSEPDGVAQNNLDQLPTF